MAYEIADKSTGESEDGLDIVKFAHECFVEDQSHWQEIYNRAIEDQQFMSDDKYAQWDQREYEARITAGRPALTVDQLTQFKHQVVNDIKMNTPSIDVIPDGGGASVEDANIFKGLIRNIEYASRADSAYDTAVNFSVGCSIGWLRVDHDYADPTSGFEQVLKICRVINPTSVWIDRNSIEVDGSDAKRGLVLEPITIKDFMRRWPGKKPVCFKDADKNGAYKEKDQIYIAEFFHIEETEEEFASEDGERTRIVTKRVVKRCKLSGQDVLEETIFPGQYIPLVPVYGEEDWQNGKRNLLSLIRKSKDAQKAFNVLRSVETEILLKQPQAPIMAAEGQIEQYKEDWVDPAKSMALRYKPVDVDGKPVGPPVRLAPPQIPAGIVNAALERVDDIKATLGLYNASIGQRSNEISGKAINARKMEGDVATYHFGDNLIKSITHVGQILVSAIPEIYDTPRIIRILGLEDEPKEIGINGEVVNGQERTFDLTQGKFSVKVTTGAAYTTKRQEAAEFFTEIVKQQPELMKVMGDLLFKNMDFNGAQAMAQRMKKLVDPKLLSPEEQAQLQKEGGTADPEKEQMTQLIQQLQAELQQAQQKLQVNEAKATADVVKSEADVKKAEMDAQLKLADMALKTKQIELDTLKLTVEAAKVENERLALLNPAPVIQQSPSKSPDMMSA